jgi:hypothetical protein
MPDDDTQTLEPTKGKLPLDFQGDEHGNVRLSKGVEVRPDADGAQDDTATPEPNGQPQTQTEPIAPKLIPEEEVERRIATIKGGHEGTVNKMRQEIEKLSEELSKAQQAMLDKEYENWLRALREEGDGEGVDLAKALAERDKRLRAEQMQFEKEKAEIMRLKKELDEAGKMKFVYETIKEYGLTDDHVEVLANLEDRWEIRAKAADLALEQTKAKAVAPVKTDKGSGKPAPRDLSGMPIEERLGLAMAGELE